MNYVVRSIHLLHNPTFPIVGTPPPFCRVVVVVVVGRLSLQQNVKKGGGALTGPQLLEGVAGKEGVTFFRGVAIFT